MIQSITLEQFFGVEGEVEELETASENTRFIEMKAGTKLFLEDFSIIDNVVEDEDEIYMQNNIIQLYKLKAAVFLL